MPGPSRTQRAEAKYNVTTDFPHLGLHSAAANGNIGLVKYALSHGQPVNSVLDGVLPLHAACSFGDEIVVKYLIDNGADVNAPRLPRRYSNEKNRANSQLIIGTSGSTPLHFASANGHTNIVITLLQHGAHADRPDKHGITPEMLARDNGYTETADLLRNWKINKDRDLWEREGPIPDYYEEETSRDRQGSLDADSSMRKRLRMKRSLEFALNTIKATTSHSHSQSGSSTATMMSRDTSQPRSPPALGEYTFYPQPSSSDPANPTSSERRPSLPHLYDAPPSAGSRKASMSSGTSCRRPRSAGTGAEPSPRRKLGTKYSLLNLFKKANGDGQPSESPSPPSESPSPPSTAQIAPVSTSPLPTSRSFSDKAPSPVEPSSRSRGARSGTEPPARMPAHVANAFDLDYSVPASHSRARSGSGASGASRTRESSTPPSRPGPSILKGHLRNPSSQSQQDGQSGSVSGRSLRFDSSSTTNASVSRQGQRTNSPRRPVRAAASPSPARDLRDHASAGSLRSGSVAGRRYTNERERPAGFSSPPVAPRKLEGESARQDSSAVDEDDEEEEYGEVIRGGLGFAASPPMDASATLPDIVTSTSGRPSALSPILSPGNLSASPTDAEFPFSMSRPPADFSSDGSAPQRPGGLRVSPGQGDNRLRGDSVSSMATDTSTNPPSSSSTSGTASAGINTPATGCHALPVGTVSPGEEYDAPGSYAGDGSHGLLLDDSEFGLALRRPHVPGGIDIRSISSHAQAEALVRQTKKSILEMDPHEENGSGLGISPLSAKLAAYGKSLALERKFKEEQAKAELKARTGELESVRKGSLNLDRSEQYISHVGAKSSPTPPRVKKVRRPHTAGGECSTEHSFGSAHARHRQGLSRSTSVHVPAHSSPLGHEDPDMANPADIEIVETAATPVEETALSNSDNDPVQADPYSYERARCRTPDPEPERFSLDEEPTSTVGVPLSRVSTAPCQDTYNSVQSRSLRYKRDHAARHIASANKLTRMGFAAPDGWQGSSGYASPANASNKQRFGGLKSFVQSLKGRA